MVTVEELRRTAEKHGIDQEPEIQQLLNKAIDIETALPDGRGRKLIQYIKAAIDKRVEQKRRKPFPEPSAVNHWNPALYFGETRAGTKLYLTLDQLAQHLGVYAQSKGGKTTLFRELMIQLDNLDQDVTWWSIDFNQDYRHLANRPDVDVLVFPFSKLRWNVLKPPPGATIDSWRKTVAEIFADSQALLDASENFSAHQLQNLYDGYKDITEDALEDLYEDKTDTAEQDFPTLLDLEASIRNQSFHPSNPSHSYQSRVLNRVQGLITDCFYTVDTVHGHDLEKLLQENVVFEFHEPRRNISTFFVELLFAWVQDYRIAQNHGDDRLRHIWFNDELKNTHSVYKEKQVESGVPAISDRFARVRNQGESVFGADQVPTLISQFILANTYVTLLGPMNDDTQFERIAKSMGVLEDPHQEGVGRNLDVGEFIVSVGSKGPYRIKAPHTHVAEDVTEAELVDLYQDDWERLLVDSTTSSSSPGEKPEKPLPSSEKVEETSEKQEQVEIELSDAGKHLIRNVAENPTAFLSARYEEFSSDYMGNKAKKELLSKNLVEEIEVTIKQGRGKLLDLTEKGRRYLDRRGIEIELKSRGGISHLYWQNRIQERLDDLGYETKLEFQNRDVYGLGPERDVAVEVALGFNQREIEHVEDAVERGYSIILVACRNPEVQGYVERKLDELDIDLSNVHVALLNDVATMNRLEDVVSS